MCMNATIKDVAREANVCIATVSRAFNDPERVSEEKKRLIFETADRLNYSPNALAKSLITKSTQTIGVLVPDIDNIFYPCVIKGIDATCFKENYLSSLANTYDSVEKEKYYISVLRNQRIDGYIFVGTRSYRSEDSRHIVELAKQVPVVMIYSDLSEYGVCSIITDDISGSKKATKYLYEQGHRRVALFSSGVPHLTYLDKQKGYEQALKELGVPEKNGVILKNQPYISGGYECMKQMCETFSEKERPTAALVISDQMALGVWRYCEEHGICIPEDFQLVGYSGTTLARELIPNLMTVDQMPDQLGQLAVKTIISMKNGEFPHMKQIIFEPKLR